MELRTVLQRGKLGNVKREMSRLQINILGLCETRGTGESDFYSDDFRIIHSGVETHQRGVALVLNKRTAHTVVKIRYEED